jgi:hypothetical protein
MRLRGGRAGEESVERGCTVEISKMINHLSIDFDPEGVVGLFSDQWF